ncbi:MAG: hypothetical protein JWM80_4595, partial [Cyanobacteria bacterium RYN_339]|nr:hypothetical protein [Cyanobacteria bacterium RYN_339]
ASATPTASPLPSPPASLVPAHASLRSQIETKLLAIAQVGFNQGRGQLAATGGLVSDAGGALIGNHSAGVISNNGGGVIANNGAGLIGPNGAGYHVLDAAIAIQTTAQAGETLISSHIWPDGMHQLIFKRTAPEGTRTVQIRGGQPTQEDLAETLETYPAGGVKSHRDSNVELIAGGKVQVKIVQREGLDEAGATTKVTFEPGSAVHDLLTGADIQLKQFEVDLVAHTGSFTSVYGGAGLTETGTLTNVKPNAVGQLLFAFWDPLVVFDGESSTTDAKGALLYKRKQRTVDGKQQRDYDLGDGLTLALATAGTDLYDGTLAKDGVQQATVHLAVSADGSSIFTVTFAEDPSHPLVIGYGLGGDGPVARPTPPPQWVVLTVAGAAEAGYKDGAAAEARFSQPAALVAGRKDPERFFLADGGNHVVRLMTRSPLAFKTFAGDGTVGYVDGPAAVARFHRPYGLAVGADDTLYIADQDDHRIRMVAPDGTVSTLAGDGKDGRIDGPGANSRFSSPSGLAIDAHGDLFVADAGSNTIRKIDLTDPAHPVTTVGGDGRPGLADGPAASAHFKTPWGLAFMPDGALYIADRDNFALRKLAGGVVTTVAGSQDVAKRFFDGPALEAGFPSPHFLAPRPDGSLYFTTGPIAYSLTPAGEVQAYAGAGFKGAADGVNFNATFTDLQGLAFSTNNVLFLVDGNLLRGVVPHL